MDEYELTCTDCGFTAVVTSTIEEVYDHIENHQAEYEADQLDHTIDFVRVDQ